MAWEVKTDEGKILGVVSDSYKPITTDQARDMIGVITIPFEQSRHETQGQIRYLDPASVIATRQTKAPWNRSRTGYGSKIPTSWQIQLTDKRWRRVYVVCWSNSGSAYICTKAGCLYFDSFEPKDFKNS